VNGNSSSRAPNFKLRHYPCLCAPTQVEPVHVAINGAGATGTELSAELHRTVRGVVAFGLDRIDPDKDIKITLIEAADRIVPALPRRLSDATARLLAELGVEVRTAARVTEVTPDGVHLAGGDFIPSELVVWAAGVRGTLQTTRDDNVFAMGDCAWLVPDGETHPIPPRARQRTSRPPIFCGNSNAAWRAGPKSPSCTTISARWCRSANSLRSQPYGVPGREGDADRRMCSPADVSLALQMHETALHGPLKVGLDT
jgi:NADH dehydrogenase